MRVDSTAMTLSPRGLEPHRLAALLVAGLVVAGCAGDTDMGDAADTAGDTASTLATEAADTQSITVADAGLATPESVLYDQAADVYLVSNINGGPLEKDDNGFISRVLPDGTVEELRWIDGAGDAVLHAPKGMAIHGDTLFVADIDTVRAFGRTSGEPLGARGVPGATFLNDLTVGPDGTLYVSDSGLAPDFSSTGTDAVYRFQGQEAVPVAQTTELSGPNGIVAFDDYVAVVGFGGSDLRVLRADGTEDGGAGQIVSSLPGGQLDGIVRLDDGSFLVSSWGEQAVYHVPAMGSDGEPAAVVEGVPSPADIGWDSQRQRVLIPVFQEDRLVFEPVRPTM